jgi:chromosomal replication initiation ATPase DnaA
MPLLGDASFLQQVTSERKELRRNPSTRLRLSLPELVHRMTSLLKIDPDALQGIHRDRMLSRARALLAYFAVQHARHPMSRVAEFLQLHPSSITKALRRANRELQEDESDIKKIFQSIPHKSKSQV